jgi:hypothetical protein
MKQGSKNILLIGGAGIALYVLMKGGDLSGGPSDIFGGKEEKGTVAGTWTGSGGDSGGSTIQEPVTKKDAAATNYTTPVAFQPSQALMDQYYQQVIEPGINAKKGITVGHIIPANSVEAITPYYAPSAPAPVQIKAATISSAQNPVTSIGSFNPSNPFGAANFSTKKAVTTGSLMPAKSVQAITPTYGGLGLTYRGTNSSGGRVYK